MNIQEFRKITMKNTPDTTEKDTSTSKELQGVKHVVVDGKGRINIPTEWRHVFSIYSEVILLSTGKYLLLMPRTLYEKNNSPDIIPLYGKIDKSGRLLLSKDVLESIGIHLGNEVYLIGKGNYVEIYTDEDIKNEAVKKSDEAVSSFRSRLLGIL